MANHVGTMIKKARTAAGMTQKELAEKADGLSATTLGKAERGETELTPQQLKAVADAIGVSPETLLGDVKEQAPEAPAATEEEVLDLYKAAASDIQKAAVSLLKGEKPPVPDPMAVFTKMLADGDVMNKFKSFLNSDTGKAFMNGAKNIFGGENNNERYGMSMSVPLMAFTFFYTVSHYILFLSFYFWLWRTDIKPEK